MRSNILSHLLKGWLKLLPAIRVIAALSAFTIAGAAEPLHFNLNRLVDGKPQAVTEKAWSGKFLLMAIGYTGCPDICPTTMLDMRQTMRTLDANPEKATQVQPLFITIDPESDTLSDITRYAAYFDSRIIGLRADNFEGLNAVVEQLRGDYGYFFDGKPVQPPNLPEGYTVMHSVYIYLYSPERQLLDTFPYNMPGSELAQRISTYLD